MGSKSKLTLFIILLVLWISAWTSAQDGLQFWPTRLDFQLEYHASSGAEGDFNNDGLMDLVVVDGIEGLVVVLLGKGNGSFHVPTFSITFPSAGSPSVLVGDFNEDGEEDLAVASYYTQFIAILLGNNDGSFQSPTIYPTDGSEITEIVSLCDVNNDDHQDIVAYRKYSEKITIFLGNGDGTFATGYSFMEGDNHRSMAIGDFNRDGNVDLVFTLASDQFMVLQGYGNGTFTWPLYYDTEGDFSTISVGDLNEDGIEDLVMGPCVQGVCIHFGYADGTFKKGVFLESPNCYCNQIVIDDLNHDNLQDLILGNRSVHLGIGDGTFQSTSTYLWSEGGSPLLGDFNEDENDDYVVFNSTDRSISVFLGKGDGNFIQAPSHGVGESSVVAMVHGDFNRDGHQDLATANNKESNISIIINNGDGSFAESVEYPSLDDNEDIAVGDFNEDSIEDLVVINGRGRGHNLFIYLGKPNGTFHLPITRYGGHRPVSVAIDDFNKDGHFDVAVASNIGAQCRVFLGIGDGTLGIPNIYDLGKGAVSVSSGDFNLDGIPDLVLPLSAHYGPVAFMIGNGDGTFQPISHHFDDISIIHLDIADINDDDIEDVILLEDDYFVIQSKIYVYQGNGDCTFQLINEFEIDSSKADKTSLADLNEDGNLDLILSHSSRTSVGIASGNGDGTFNELVSYGASPRSSLPVAADFDGDGHEDLAVPNVYDSLCRFSLLVNSSEICVLKKPKDKAVLRKPPQFEWYPIEGATALEIVLKDEQEQVIWSSLLPGDLTSVQYTGPVLKDVGPYSWTVRSLVDGVWGNESLARSFRYEKPTFLRPTPKAPHFKP